VSCTHSFAKEIRHEKSCTHLSKCAMHSMFVLSTSVIALDDTFILVYWSIFVASV